MPTILEPLPDAAGQGTMVWNVGELGYVAEEYLLCGYADVYAPVAMADAPNMLLRNIPHDMARRRDYRRAVLRAALPYCTRVIIYRPGDLHRFSGTAIVETAHPLQGGLAIVWSQLSGYFIQHGDVYVGIAPPVTFDSLRRSNPTRYARLQAADTTQLWGMIAQLGDLLRSRHLPGDTGRLRIHTLLLTGYSYTGVAASTFANFHHQTARRSSGGPIFDGYVSIANSMYVRPIDVPVLRIMTQSDFNSFGGLNNRREDSDAPGSRFRLWEVTGASHLNASPIVAPAARPWAGTPLLEPSNLPHFSASDCQRGFPVGAGPNTLPLNAVMISAFEHIEHWSAGGTAPPSASRIETTADGKALLDDSGNALGGLRLPEIRVPAATYGTGTDQCFLYGYRLPFAAEHMRDLYGSRDHYLQSLQAAAEADVKAGWLRAADAGSIVSAAGQLESF